MYEIKKLDPSHLKIAQRLFILFAEVFEEKSLQASDLPTEAYLAELLAKPSFHVFAALAGDQVVGGLTAYAMERYLSEQKELYLFDIAVTEAHRRQGLATKLMAALKKYAEGVQVSTIFLEVHVEDVEAVAFYNAIGGEIEAVHHFNFHIT
jgi:aminoglycoside 3-N-acetyltransferase I